MSHEETRKPVRIRVGNTLTPFGMALRQSDNPVDLSELTVKFVAYDKQSGAVAVTETASNVTKHPTFAFTVDTTANRIKCIGHPAREGDQIVVSSAGTLPTGLAADTRYFVHHADSNSLVVGLYKSGNAVTISTSGSGDHTFYVVGHAQYDWQAADVATKRKLRCYFNVYDDDESQSFPADEEGYPVWVS